MIITSLGQRIVVRYARKPIWMPTARSKLFRIAEHTFYSEDEVRQIRLLQTAYRAQEASIQEFMKHEFYIPATQSGGLPPEFIKLELERDQQIYAENDRENARIAKIKEEMMQKQLKELEEKVMEAKLTEEEDLMQIGLQVDDYIERHKSDPNSFVTPDNIDALIEKAIETPVSFEYCIDSLGRRYGMTDRLNDDKSNQKSTRGQ